MERDVGAAVGGGKVEELRWVLWLAALGCDLAAPLARYWLPRPGRPR